MADIIVFLVRYPIKVDFSETARNFIFTTRISILEYTSSTLGIIQLYSAV